MGRRSPPGVPPGGLPGIPRQLERQLLDLWKWIVDSFSGSPFPHADTHRPDSSFDPLATAAPANPTGPAALEGTAGTVMRSDATIKQGIVTAKGQLVGFSTEPAPVPAGVSDGQVLTRSAAAATGMAWIAPSSEDAELLAWAAIMEIL